MQGMKFSGIYFVVADMTKTVAFYRLVGLDVPDGSESQVHVRVVVDGVAFAFGTKELTLGYNPGWRVASESTPNALQFDLPTREAVDEMHERLTSAGHGSVLAPVDAFWGSRYAEVRDPDDNVVGFHSPRDPSKAGPPPL